MMTHEAGLDAASVRVLEGKEGVGIAWGVPGEAWGIFGNFWREKTYAGPRVKRTDTIRPREA
jgi:hypothetical protein